MWFLMIYWLYPEEMGRFSSVLILRKFLRIESKICLCDWIWIENNIALLLSWPIILHDFFEIPAAVFAWSRCRTNKPTNKLQRRTWITSCSSVIVLFLSNDHLHVSHPFPAPRQVKIDAGVATPERMTPGYLNHLDLGEAVATLVERRNVSHTVFTVNCPADLKTILLEKNL